MAPLPPLETETAGARALSAGKVRRRHVLFVPGYDPNAPRRYRELYRREGAKQAAISGYELQVFPDRPDNGAYGWTVVTRFGQADVRTTVEFLTWEDIVRASMDRTLGATYVAMLRTAWIYMSTGALWRLLQLRPAPMIAAVYPLAGLILQFLVAVLTGLLGFLLAGLIAPQAVAVAVAVALWFAVLQGFRKIDARLFVHYLMLDYAFTAQGRGRWPEALQGRIAQFAARIAALRRIKEIDEVLVVGHSSGAQIAVSAIAGMLRQDEAAGPPVGLLTIGQVIPMVSFLPEAQSLRRDLAELACHEGVDWVDISAPGDGGCFALSDPVRVSGVLPNNAPSRGPKVLSAAFSQTMSAEWLKATRWRFFRRHFQYLCAFEMPRDYDYFAITAGPRSLAARYAHRRSSASQVTTPLSGYRST